MSRTQWFTRRFWLALLMVCIAFSSVACDLLPVSTTTGSRTATPNVGRHRIAARTVGSQAEFYDVSTGHTFTPRGVNLINLVAAGDGTLQDRSFAVGVYNHNDIANIFDRLRRRGFNTVRMFLDSCQGGSVCLTRPGQLGLNPDVLNNVVDATRLAATHDIVLLLTSNDIPDDGGYGARANAGASDQFAGYRNAHMLTPQGVEAASNYWHDVISGLLDHGVVLQGVLAWELLNEQWLFEEQPPLSLTSGAVTTANSHSYNVASLEEKHQMVADGVTYYIAQVGRQIRALDPTALLTMGFFMPAFPDGRTISPGWYTDVKPLLVHSNLDFFDLHLYPGGYSIADQAANFGIVDYTAKPILMGEVGAFMNTYNSMASAAPAVQQWIADSCRYHFGGWLYWAYRTSPTGVSDATWSFEHEGGAMLEALAPDVQPDQCHPRLAANPNLALGATVRASASAAGPAANAVDGSSSTSWNSGGGAPQWIEVDLGSPHNLAAIRLQTSMYPNGKTDHRLLVGGPSGSFRLVHEFIGPTTDKQWLEYRPSTSLTSVQVIRVETVHSPSWVSWFEIEAIAEP
jgi:F5/8 type C domain